MGDKFLNIVGATLYNLAVAVALAVWLAGSYLMAQHVNALAGVVWAVAFPLLLVVPRVNGKT